MKELKPVWLYFENGVFLEAKAFGNASTKVGEAVFNTSLTGYQEIMTDPSYAGQFIVFTMPEIGIVGVNDDDMESSKLHASGIILRNLSLAYSNHRAKSSLVQFMKDYEGLGICGVDTRYLTKMLRDEGSMMMIASVEIRDKEQLKSLLEASPRIEDINHVQNVSTKKIYTHNTGTWNHERQSYNKPNNQNNKKVVVVDFGIKKNILNSLCQSGLDVEVVSWDFDDNRLIEQYKSKQVDGVFLSNGPGDPRSLKNIAKKIKNLIDAKIPMFGICLGHQLICSAFGHEVYKLKFGQHGGNHPVFDTKNKKVQITSQNHNYNVPESIKQIAKITHYNLFDKTIEGVEYKDYPVFSVQHHPEASPGPHESSDVFEKFIDIL